MRCLHTTCVTILQVILSSLVQLATINHQVSSEALDVLLNLLSSLQGEQLIQLLSAWYCSVDLKLCQILHHFLFHNVHVHIMCYFVSGAEGLMVCKTLVAIAAHTTNIWDHVTPKLMTYLESKIENHHEILVLNNVVHLIFFSLTPS